MREFAKVSPQFWINENGRQIKKLGLEAKLIALYLLTNPHATMIGIYYLPITFIAHEVGLPFEGALKGLQSLIEIDFCSYDESSEYVWVHDLAKDQISAQLKPNDNRIKSINEAYENLPDLPYLQTFYDKYAQYFFIEKVRKNHSPSEGASKSLLSKKKENKKENEKKKILMSSSSDVVLEKDSSPSNKNLPTMLKTDAIEILKFLNEKTGRIYRPVDTNLKLIMARLKSGASVMDCRQVIAKKTREWIKDPKMAEYLRPATLFNATKFEQYMGELVVPKDESQAHGN